MKTLVTAVMTAAAIAAAAGIATAQPSNDRAEIEKVLAAYETALNGSDVETILTLYAPDGVFMPQHSLPSVGTEAIRTAYGAVFAAIKLEITFTIDEIVEISPSWAFARTRSNGFVTINATGDRMAEANQELFIFSKTDAGAWHIARYIFCTTNAPR